MVSENNFEGEDQGEVIENTNTKQIERIQMIAEEQNKQIEEYNKLNKAHILLEQVNQNLKNDKDNMKNNEENNDENIEINLNKNEHILRNKKHARDKEQKNEDGGDEDDDDDDDDDEVNDHDDDDDDDDVDYVDVFVRYCLSFKIGKCMFF